MERGAPSTRQTTATGSWWAMAIWAASPADLDPPFFGRHPQDLVLHGQLADLALSLPQRPIIDRPVGPLALQALLAASKKSSRQAASRCASTCSSRESSSSDSPRSSCSTASIFLPADHLGRDR